MTSSEHDSTSKAESRAAPKSKQSANAGDQNRVHISVIAFLAAILVFFSVNCNAEDQIGAAFFDLSRVESDLSLSINKACVKYKIDCPLFVAMLTVESRLDYKAVNKRTRDYGIGQINIHTARHYKFDLHKLVSDQDYSVNAAALVFSHFKRSYAKKEPHTWVCRYNVGSGVLVGKKLVNCNRYLVKLKVAGAQRVVAYDH